MQNFKVHAKFPSGGGGGGGGYPENFFGHQHILQRAIRASLEESNYISRGYVPVFLRKHIATCDFPGGPGRLIPPLDLPMLFYLVSVAEQAGFTYVEANMKHALQKGTNIQFETVSQYRDQVLNNHDTVVTGTTCQNKAVCLGMSPSQITNKLRTH